MILIADSGSTKCDWKLISSSGKTESLCTSGINPFFRSADSIHEELLVALLPGLKEKVDQIHFYGSGIINDEKANVIRLALGKLFPTAGIELFSDIVAASRSLFGTNQGIACILGTGSNACLYDGQKVVEGISPLGFILGDEGSGAVLGRRLLGDFFKEVMPEPLRKKFEQEYQPIRAEVLQRVYKAERPNQYLASFVPFLSEELSTDYAKELVKGSLNDFFQRNVIKISDYKSYSIGFVGSVAYHFRELVAETCDNYHLNCQAILQNPLEELVKYHLNNPI